MQLPVVTSPGLGVRLPCAQFAWKPGRRSMRVTDTTNAAVADTWNRLAYKLKATSAQKLGLRNSWSLIS